MRVEDRSAKQRVSVRHAEVMPIGATRGDAQLAAITYLFQHPKLARVRLQLATDDGPLRTDLTKLNCAQIAVHSATDSRNHPQLAEAAREAVHAFGAAGVQEPTLLAATDGSFGRASRTGGWAWISSDGRHGNGSLPHVNGIAVVELIAVAELLAATPARQPLRVSVDSQEALRLISDAQELLAAARGDAHGAARRPGIASARPECRAARRTANLLYGRDVTFEWVKGHGDDVLNCGADRLAVYGRRAGEAGIESQVAGKVVARIAAETMTAWRQQKQPGRSIDVPSPSAPTPDSTGLATSARPHPARSSRSKHVVALAPRGSKTAAAAAS